MAVTQEEIDSVVEKCASAGYDAKVCGRTVISEVCHISEKKARAIQKELRDRAGLKTVSSSIRVMEPLVPSEPPKPTREDEVSKDKWTINLTSDRVKNYDELVKECKVDLSLWEPDRFKIKSYEVTYVPRATRQHQEDKWVRKSSDAKTVTMFAITASFIRRKDAAQAKAVMAEIEKEFAGLLKGQVVCRPKTEPSDTGYVLEVNIADQHFGKLGWTPETLEPGSDLDTTTAQWRRAVMYILENTTRYSYDEIIFVVGNDISQIDNHRRTTTHGTFVDVSSRYAQIYVRVLAEVVWAVKQCLLYAPKVRIVVVPGNHDYNTCFTLGVALGLVFNGSEAVVVDNEPSVKKVYRFGKCLVGWEHGHERAKRKHIALNMAVDFPALWGMTEFREIHTGHEHHLEVEDVQSVLVRRVASLTSNDYWHSTSGYIAQRATEAFMYHKERGLVGTCLYVESRQRPLLAETA